MLEKLISPQTQAEVILEISKIAGPVGSKWCYTIKSIEIIPEINLAFVRLNFQTAAIGGIEGFCCELTGSSSTEGNPEAVEASLARALEHGLVLLKAYLSDIQQPCTSKEDDVIVGGSIDSDSSFENGDETPVALEVDFFHLNQESFLMKCEELKKLDNLDEARKRHQVLSNFNLRPDQKEVLIRILNKRITDLENIALFGDIPEVDADIPAVNA